MQVKSIGEHSAIISTLLLCHHLSLRSLFCLFLSGSLRQVLLYSIIEGQLELFIVDRHILITANFNF